jgi:uncharacterized protein (TIGR02145 family)
MFINNRTIRVLFLAVALCLVVARFSLSAAQGVVGSGTFTDTRDGKTYRTMKIGKQTWMAENLNYKPKAGNSWCYNDSDSYCAQYGRLYDMETAKKICPAGWHLPSRREWDSLGRAAGGKSEVGLYEITFWDGAGKRLKTRSGWNWNKEDNANGNGTDDYEFSALPGGYYDGAGFYKAGNEGHWRTATESDAYYAYNRCMADYHDGLHERTGNKDNGISVRCAKNTL